MLAAFDQVTRNTCGVIRPESKPVFVVGLRELAYATFDEWRDEIIGGNAEVVLCPVGGKIDAAKVGPRPPSIWRQWCNRTP